MKKILICFFITLGFVTSIFASDFYKGNGMEGKRLAIEDPEFKNLNFDDKVYLQDLVNYLTERFQTFAGFDMIDIQNQEKIKKEQAKSESRQYDDRTALTAGKLLFAEYSAFVSVSKAGSSYSLYIKITDLTTMRIIASEIIKNINKITDIEDIAVNNLMLKIIPKMGVELTARGIYELKGNKDYTVDQELKFISEQEKDHQEKLDKVNSKLKNLSKTGSLIEQNIEKERLESEKQFEEQRLAIVKEQKARLIEQQEKAEKEKIKAAERSQEINKKISDISAKVDKMATEIENKEYKILSYSEQIEIIEKYKKAYLEIRSKVEKEIETLYANAGKEYNENKINIDDVSQYRMAEKENGVPTEDAKNNRRVKNQELYDSLMNEAEKNAEDLISKTKYETYLKSIREKQNTLSKLQKINSLKDKDDLLLSVGEYNGKRRAWPCSVKIIRDGKVLISDAFDINFNDLSKALDGTVYSQDEMLGKSNNDKYTSYLDNVEIYDSMFRVGYPVVFLETEVIVKPLSKENPSGYTMSISKHTLKATTTKKIVTTELRSDKSVTFYSSPAYDIRTKEELAKSKEEHDKQLKAILDAQEKQEKEKAAQQIAQQKAQQKAVERNLAKKATANMEKVGYLYSMGISAGRFSILLAYESPISMFSNKIFGGLDLALAFDKNVEGVFCDLGARLGFVNFLTYGNHPGLFFALGLGFRSHPERTTDPSAYYILGETGMDFTLSKLCMFEIKYQLDYDKYFCFSNRFYLGLLVNLNRL